jgi:hypothetical protein
MSVVAPVKANGISGQKPSHHCGDRRGTGFKQNMNMVWHQSPGKTWRTGLGQNNSQPFQKIVPVIVIVKYLSALYAPDNNVMQGAGRVYAGFSWHDLLITP